MGNLSAILAAILCATAPLASAEIQEPKTEESQSNFKLGKETISLVRASFEKGDYDAFLTEMDTSYTQAVAENGLDGLVQMRQKQVPADFQQKWEQQFSDLQKQKNQELLNAVSDKDSSIFAAKVRSLAANLSTPEQEKAISLLNNLISMAPNTGKNADENKLIDIDIEYEYKLLHAAVPSSAVSPQEIQSQQNALRMEKMDKMVAASKTFQDHELKQSVSLATANLDARLARNLDGADLNAYIKGNAKPSNELEETVTAILVSYQGQFSDLMKNIADANH
jgi:hypothetical protein